MILLIMLTPIKKSSCSVSVFKSRIHKDSSAADRLVDAKYEKLGRKDGEKYLKSFILDAIGEITGTNRFEDYPSTQSESPGRYGVIDVSLPDSFSMY
jgi:hypothetical protein